MRLAILFFLATQLADAGVITLAGCSTFTNELPVDAVESSSACLIDRHEGTFPDFDVEASINTGWQPEEFEALFSVSGYVNPTISRVYGEDSFLVESQRAEILANFLFDWTTTGPPRDGFVEINVLGLVLTSNVFTGAQWQIGEIADDWIPDAAMSRLERASVLPFRLGLPFTTSLTFSMVSTSDIVEPSEGRSSIALNFRLTELDGSPVEFTDIVVPEPSTWLLVGSALILLLITIRRGTACESACARSSNERRNSCRTPR